MFVDEISLTITAGKGGDGKASFFPNHGKPSGGNGGDGGDVYAIVNPQYSNLNRYAGFTQLDAKNGVQGGSFRRAGAKGEDIIIELPIGSSVIDINSNETFELDREDKKILLCMGGKGGRGNSTLKKSTDRGPTEFEKGQKGQSRTIQIILKLIADFGFVGLPNTGKSTLLNELTSAHAEVANYAFTTLEPHLGVLNKKILADIPGLIEGASVGKGLGIKFLKHIEKVSLLLHCISSESNNVLKDYKTVMRELSQYSEILSQKDFIILLTKTDLITDKEIKNKVKQLQKITKNVYPVSILEPVSIEKIKQVLLS